MKNWNRENVNRISYLTNGKSDVIFKHCTTLWSSNSYIKPKATKIHDSVEILLYSYICLFIIV